MLAVADAVEGTGDMPAELRTALLCQQWDALPEAGGVFDQPAGLLAKMSYAINIYKALSSEKTRGNISLVEWSKQYPDYYRIVVQVERMRK